VQATVIVIKELGWRKERNTVKKVKHALLGRIAQHHYEGASEVWPVRGGAAHL